MIYVLLLIYIMVISLLFKVLAPNRKKLYLFLCFIPMLIIMGFRSKYVGTDTYSYCNYFRNIVKTSFIKGLQDNTIIWLILNKIFGLFGTNNINYIFPLSLLIMIFSFKFIYDYSDDVFMSVILFILSYFYFSAFNGARQFLSVAIVINSFKFLLSSRKEDNKKNIALYILINIIAILIHPISIIFLITFPLIFMKPTKRNIARYFILLIIISIAFVPIANLFAKYFPHYSLYINAEGITDYGFGKGKNRSFIITIIYMIFELILLRTFNDKYTAKKDLKKHFCYIIINMIGIFLGVMSLKSIMFSRLAWYFTIFSIIYIPYTFEKIKANQRFLIKIFYIIIMIIPFYIQLSGNTHGILPFKFIWEVIL